MYSTSVLLTLLPALPAVLAHGRIDVVQGNLGGNGTGLGVQGASVDGSGPNYKTEVDTTVFWSNKIDTDDDIGYTQGKGSNNEIDDIEQSMALAGGQLPQVSSTGGSVKGTWHIVTEDGAGPVQALVDSSATGKWSEADEATVTTQPPGDNGNIVAGQTPQSKERRRGFMGFVRSIFRRNDGNVNEDYVSDFWPAPPQ